MSLSPALALSLVVEPIGQVPVVTGFSVWREYRSLSGFAKVSGVSPSTSPFPQDSPVSLRSRPRSARTGRHGIPVTHELTGYVHSRRATPHPAGPRRAPPGQSTRVHERSPGPVLEVARAGRAECQPKVSSG